MPRGSGFDRALAPLRVGELLGRLSLAFDVANQATPGATVRRTVLAVELGTRLGASRQELRETYWETLLDCLGRPGLEQVFADERSAGWVPSASKRDVEQALQSALRTLVHLAPDAPFTRRVRHLCARLANPGLGLLPLPTEPPTLATRLREVAGLVESAREQRGRAGGLDLVTGGGGRLDPEFWSLLSTEQAALFDAIEDPRIFQRFVDLEPEPAEWVYALQVDELARALATLIEVETPVFLGHSAGVAALAERAALHLGLAPEQIRTICLAALLHDVGRVSVPKALWMRQGPLDWGAWERVRLSPYYTERVLSPIESLAEVAEIAAAAHERIDGSGYPQRRSSRTLSTSARVLAAAHMARAMSEPRPHRPASNSNDIARELVAAVNAGRLDAGAVDAVLACLGVSNRTVPSGSHGLSQRELEVSRLLARGQSDKEIGATLRISPRTVQVHVGRILDKLGVRSRAGAAVWLIEHGVAL